jgi:hypothetical protein
MKLTGQIQVDKESPRGRGVAALPASSHEDYVSIWGAPQELEPIKCEIELLIGWKRSGACGAWWGPAQSATYDRREKELTDRLVDWKAHWAAEGVDVVKALVEVFTSPTGRVWELDPQIKVLARRWAGVEPE